MFTVCPKCALTLVVTAADLRVAQGYVRCGRCSSVFNALARLTEERGGASLPAAEAVAALEREAAQAEAAAASLEEEAAESAAPGEEPPLSLAEDESPSDEALEFNPTTTDVNSVFVQPPPDPQWTAATGSFKALIAANDEPLPAQPASEGPVEVEIDAAFFASMLSSESPARVSQPVPEPSVTPAPPAARPAKPAALAAPAPARALPAPVPPARKAPVPVFDRADADGAGLLLKEESFEQSPGAQEAVDVDAQTQTAERFGALARLREHGWSLGALLALLLLGAQVVNHYRDELAASTRFNRPLTALYERLGVKLFPHWDLHAYDVRQLGASAEPTGPALITVRASIKNGADQPQPLPLLRVTLQDRFGNRIAMRDVAPQSYLPPTIPPASFLAAGQRIDAEMGFADPGAEAVGFEIDACLPARGGVACANDAALR
jgi:predicted Zn finger-like uncharacterized protein